MTQQEILYIMEKVFNDEASRWQFEFDYVPVKKPEIAAKIIMRGKTLIIKTDSYEDFILNKQLLEEGFNKALKYLSIGIKDKKTIEKFNNILTWPLERIHIAMIYTVYGSIENKKLDNYACKYKKYL